MACMCGDTHCWSCGPAQGNWKCILCGSWADDCCAHLLENGKGYRPEFQAEVLVAEEKERLYWESYAREYEDGSI